MRRLCTAICLLLVLGAAPAAAKVIDVSASPNPAGLGDRVRHTVTLGTYGRLEIWVSATGFDRPAMGTLPSGAWTYECCPAHTAGTPAWRFRSTGIAGPATYGFRASTRARGTYLSTAAAGGSSAGVWIQVR